MSADEVEPYVAYCLQGDKMNFALWPLEDGRRALALFLSVELAREHVRDADGSPEWRIVRPAKPDLLKVLEECWEAGILHAVLETGQPGEHLIFDILEVLQAERRAGG
ncbi:MAG TPA: hypothetical protein VMV10_28555 [Pirellulales bacterium]|nr:hypothetical protein [Pirellulales bacterium]